jgi:FixJ family two-component response regulator
MPAAQPVIAVLDDEPEMRKALRRLLTSRGFRVEEYGGGDQFFAGVGAHPLDCLLLDLHMPGLSGFEILAVLRARQIPLPVIVITAHDEPDTAERVRTLGASAYLKKPVDQEALLSAIAAVLPLGMPPRNVGPQSVPRTKES